jgi:membrane protease YdiL (CAAX protease family)
MKSYLQSANNSIIRFNNYQNKVIMDLYNTKDKTSKVAWGVFYGFSAIAVGAACATITAKLGGYHFNIIDTFKKEIIAFDDATLSAFSFTKKTQPIRLRIAYPFMLILWTIPIAGVGSPIIEELFYRELIQTEILKNKLKPLVDSYCPKLSNSPTTMKIVRIVVSNILFSLHYLPDFYMGIKSSKSIPVWLACYFGMGLAFSAAREHKDVFTSIVAHATLNSAFIVARQVSAIAYIYFNHRFSVV